MKLVIRSDESTTEFPLESDGAWKLGRHPENDIVIDDPRASRSHGLFIARNGAFFFEDAGTGNGSAISGVAVPQKTRVEVTEGDTIEIGEVSLLLVASDPAEESPAGRIPPGKMGVLTDLTAPGKPRIFLREESHLLGRLPTCQARVDDPGASRLHSEIGREELRYYLRDLGSANGTFLNEKRVRKEVLRPGDVVRIGNQRFEFAFADPPAEKAPATAVGSRGSVRGHPVAVALISALISGGLVYLLVSNRGANAGSGLSPDSAPAVGLAEDDGAPVVVANPIVRDISITLERTGDVHFARRDIIPFPLGRKVAKVHVENRQRVATDDALVTFELPKELRSARKQALAAVSQAEEEVLKVGSEVAKADALLESARANLAIIEGTHGRSEPLYEDGNLLQGEWDEIRMKLAEAEAAVKLRTEEKKQAERSVTQAEQRVVQVRADLDDVESRIEDLTVRANAPGIVNRLDLEDGFTVTTVNSSMELIEYEREVTVVVPVSEDEVVSLRDGVEAEVWLSGTPDATVRGRVTFIPPTAVNRNYEIEVTVPNREKRFRPGQQVSVRFLTGTRKDAILVPLSALDSNSPTGYHLFVVDPATSTARLLPVGRGRKLTDRDREMIEVLPRGEGPVLSRDSLVVVEGNRALRDGARVVIRSPREVTGSPE